jgi:uncharacterized repeat protein (TIGR03803 family)
MTMLRSVFMLSATSLAAALLCQPVAAQTETTIHNFSCAPDGCEPYTGLTWNAKHTLLYGTTSSGGPSGSPGDGTIFELTPPKGSKKPWEYKVIYSLDEIPGGSQPHSSLTLYDNALYGAATSGGSATCQCGTIFELDKVKGAWTYSVLYTFTGYTNGDGANPNGGVAFDANGNLWGTTTDGGTSTNCASFGCGTIFEISKVKGKWKYQIVYSFQGNTQDTTDGANPYGTPLVTSAGDVIGTTCCAGVNSGTAWEVSPAGNGNWSYQTVFWFDTYQNTGTEPDAGVIADADGNLYGTTQGQVIAYELTAASSYGVEDQLWEPSPALVTTLAPLAFDSSGNLYGSGLNGGCDVQDSGDGCVFEISPNEDGGWNASILHVFTGADGETVQGAVTLDSKGHVIGTTSQGGSNGEGVIFEITP